MDGAHSKHTKYNGCLFVLEGSDGDGKNVILAVALAPKESEENYDWFVGNCKASGLGEWLDRPGQAMITDRHKGIPGAVSTYLPKCTQINCMRHMINNMRTKCGVFNDAEVWKLRDSQTKELFEKRLAALRGRSPKAADYLSKVPLFKWALYAVSAALYGHRTSNRVESENSRLLPSRFEDPYGFLEKSLFVIMDILRTNMKSAEGYVKEKMFLTPYAQKIYDLNDRKSQATEVRVATDNVCYVTYKAAQTETRRYLQSTRHCYSRLCTLATVRSHCADTLCTHNLCTLDFGFSHSVHSRLCTLRLHSRLWILALSVLSTLHSRTVLTLSALLSALALSAQTTAAVAVAAAGQIIAAALLPLPTPLLPCCRRRPCR
jgi:hypothetical protein